MHNYNAVEVLSVLALFMWVCILSMILSFLFGKQI